MVYKKEAMPTDDKILISVSYALRLALVYALTLGLWYKHWLTVFVSIAALILTFLPSLISHNYRINLPTEFELLTVIFIYLALILGETKGYYARFWWWDNMLHTFSGIAFGFFGFLAVYTLYKAGKINTKPIFLVLVAFSLAMSIGALWEIFEFNLDNTFHTNMQRQETGVKDTMYDLTEDAAGAIFTSILGFFYFKGVKGSGIFDSLVKRFVKRNPHLFEEK